MPKLSSETYGISVSGIHIHQHHKPSNKRKENLVMLNQLVLTGNLGNSPEIFYSSQGNPVASFNIAFKSSKKKTGWIKVVCFNRLAEVAEKYLKTGDRVSVIGTLDQQRWENEEGLARSSFQLILKQANI